LEVDANPGAGLLLSNPNNFKPLKPANLRGEAVIVEF